MTGTIEPRAVATDTDSLAPLRRALLDAAVHDAAAIRAEAEAEAARLRAEAAERAASILAEARARGEAEGSARVAAQRSGARREARTVTLEAQRAAYDRVRDEAVAAVAAVVRRPVERGRLTALVRESLGPDATITDLPRGGLAGESADGRRVDASAETLVALAMAELDLEQLWAP